MAESRKKPIALVLSGGVSAGAYIAGALDELIAAFNQSDDYEIDIITGGSAGATTGAIVAQGLLFRGGGTSLYQTRVEDVDLFAMLERETNPDGQVTLLNGETIEQIARNALAWNGPDTRARCCAPELTLSMTIANTTALPYVASIEVPTAEGSEPFIQYRNAEQQAFEFDEQTVRDDAQWGEVANVARASSAIPFVFPRVLLQRDPANISHYRFKPEISGPTAFWYYDGGTFNNLPVNLARYFIAQKHEAPGAGNTPRVIMVNPWQSSVRVQQIPETPPDLLDFGMRLIEGIRNESSMIEFREPVRVVDEPEPRSNPADMSWAIPGISAPDVGMLSRTRMVTPARSLPRLRCNYFGHLSAFLDRQFREYDFRRGAADAKLLLSTMKLSYVSDRPAGFYEPDVDPAFAGIDISTYDQVAQLRLSSGEDAGRPIGEALEAALEKRTDYLLNRLFDAVEVPGGPIVAAAAKRLLDWKVLKMGDIVRKAW